MKYVICLLLFVCHFTLPAIANENLITAMKEMKSSYKNIKRGVRRNNFSNLKVEIEKLKKNIELSINLKPSTTEDITGYQNALKELQSLVSNLDWAISDQNQDQANRYLNEIKNLMRQSHKIYDR